MLGAKAFYHLQSLPPPANSSDNDVLVSNTTDELASSSNATGAATAQSKDMLPRMLVMGGCSGSSFIMLVAMKLLEVHGIPFVWFDDTEMLKPEKNKFYTWETGMGSAMKKANEDALSRGGVLAFQAMTNMLTTEGSGEQGGQVEVTWDDVKDDLKGMGTHVVYAKRENLLDHAVCKVRDCFTSQFGIPVDENGQRSKLCFDRRKAESGEYKAKMIPPKLVKMIKKTADDVELEQKILAETFPQFNVVTMEDLLAYQYSEDDLTTSVEAWKSFMESWGVPPDMDAIKKFLQKDIGSHKKPGPHSETIYNIDEVKEELLNEHLDKYLRE
jgi:hypothetical protein